MHPNNPRNRGEITAILALFSASICILCILLYNLPDFEPAHRERLKLPKNFEDVKDIGKILNLYTENYYFSVMCGFSITYIFLQTFSIPGSIFLSFLAGALFGLPVGVVLVCILSTIGATNCYMMSHLLGRNLVNKMFPNKLELFGKELEKHKRNILNYVLFLRFTPVIPNWFVNIASPIFGIPVKDFAIGTFFGVMPQTIVAVKAGLTLQSFNSPSDVLDYRIFLTMSALAVVSLLPTWKPFQRFLDKLLNKSVHHD